MNFVLSAGISTFLESTDSYIVIWIFRYVWITEVDCIVSEITSMTKKDRNNNQNFLDKMKCDVGLMINLYYKWVVANQIQSKSISIHFTCDFDPNGSAS